MTTPTGQISLNDVNVELGLSGTTTISLNQTNVRTLAGVASGQISMNDLRGKSNRVSLSYTYSANTANASLNVTSISGYIAGKSDITITVNSGIYIYSTATGTPALALTGGSTGDTITLVNNGYIMGMGGNGGSATSDSTSAHTAPTVGGTALSLGFNTTVNNTNASAYIGGGGGGGGFGYEITKSVYVKVPGGGGAGGGTGGTWYQQGTTKAGGSGGSIGSSGGNGTPNGNGTSAGGGGRIFPGTGGTSPYMSTGAAGGGGAGGAGGRSTYASPTTGGNGGSANNAGSNGSIGGAGSPIAAGGGGGGWGASGGAGVYSGSSIVYENGAAGGKAVALNGKTVTWVSGNTTRVYGAVA